MSKVYKVTVIGAGDRGRTYSKMLNKYHAKDVEMCGICDVLDDRAQKAVEEFGFAKKFSDWKQAILETKPDVVIVATPAFFHCDMAAFAMENGCHVLTEKPFDLDMKKCFDLKETQKKTGKVLAIGLQYRNRKPARALKYAVERNLLGKNIIMNYTNIAMNRPKTAMHDAEFGNGGPMVDLICHFLDLMRWYYNSNPKSVSGKWFTNTENLERLSSIKNKAPDNSTMIIEYECGNLGVMISNWGMPTDMGSYGMQYALGSEGIVKAQNKPADGSPGIVVSRVNEEVIVNINPEDEQDAINDELAVYDHFIAEIEGRGKCQASFEEGIYSLATSMAGLKSGALGRPVTIAEILETKPTVLQCIKGE